MVMIVFWGVFAVIVYCVFVGGVVFTPVHIFHCSCTYIHAAIHTFTYIHIHSHTYTYIHIHTHTFTYIAGCILEQTVVKLYIIQPGVYALLCTNVTQTVYSTIQPYTMHALYVCVICSNTCI